MQINGNMKNVRDPIDDLFKQKLEGYQIKPSAKVWTNIVNRFMHPKTGYFHLVNLQNIIGAVILAGAGITAYVMLNSSDSNQTPEGKALTGILTDPSTANLQTAPLNANPVGMPADQTTVNPREATEPHNSHQKNSSIIENPEAKGAETGRAISQEMAATLPDDDQTSDPLAAEDVTERVIFGSLSRIPFLSSPVELTISKDLRQPPGMDRKNQRNNKDIRMRRDDYRKPVQFSAGLHFLPEWTDYGNESGALQSGYTQEIMASAQMGNFVLRTGLGLTRAQDYGNYDVNYSKYEMTGYYLGTNFESWGNPTDTMSYVLDEHGVYDTVFYNESYRTDNTYTYLQIPLQIGYQFFNTQRFSLMVTGGPCLSLLLNEKKSDPAVSDFAAENVMMVDQTPEKRYSNWQLLLGLSSQYMITGKFSLSLEPTYRQYFKSTYDGNGSEWPPYSLGIRAGLTYHF